jgi:predicted SAM-dependent methyltransferase
MKLYLGSRDYRPEGFLRVDIDPIHAPDIVADVTDLSGIASESVEEICASHILEHLPWPTAYKALGEWARILRVGGLLRLAVPDLGALGAMVASGRNPWAAAGLIFGLGRLSNPLEAHQYGYTRRMLIDVLGALGFRAFDWWKHDVPDASNGWIHDEAGERIAISLNIAAKKHTAPVVPPAELMPDLLAEPMAPFDRVLATHLGCQTEPLEPATEAEPLLTQRLHFALIDARMRILFLEDELRAIREERA